MNIPITITVFSQIIEDAAQIFKSKLELDYSNILIKRRDRLIHDEKVSFGDNLYWEKNLDIAGSTFWTIGASDGLNVCFDLFGVNQLYFYRTLKEKFIDKGNTVADLRKSSLVSIFREFGFEGDEHTFFSYLIRYIKQLPVSSFDVSQQINLIRVARKIGEDPIIRNNEIIKWNIKTLTENFKLRLSNTKWYLYFYGYGIDGQIINDESDWQIARLVLEFDESAGKDLNVWIENTENPNHRDYFGKTAFSESTEKVLVINLRTYERNTPPTRQLNIKFFVDGAEGSLFFGQYLNYEVNSGRIFSGDIVIEQVKKVEKNKPLVSFIFKGTKSELDRPLGQHLREIEHVIPLFLNSKQVFRETKTELYTIRNNGSKQEIVAISAMADL